VAGILGESRAVGLALGYLPSTRRTRGQAALFPARREGRGAWPQGAAKGRDSCCETVRLGVGCFAADRAEARIGSPSALPISGCIR